MNKCDLTPSTESTQLRTKIDMTRDAANIQGSCWWPGYSVTKNYGGIADSLSVIHHNYPALPPSYPWISTSMPESPYELSVIKGALSWKAPELTGEIDDCVRFVVYRFDSDKSFDLEDASKIVAITPEKTIQIKKPGYYVVTALNRINNESFPSESIRVK